jgi:hypothetical protein
VSGGLSHGESERQRSTRVSVTGPVLQDVTRYVSRHTATHLHGETVVLAPGSVTWPTAVFRAVRSRTDRTRLHQLGGLYRTSGTVSRAVRHGAVARPHAVTGGICAAPVHRRERTRVQNRMDSAGFEPAAFPVPGG